MFENQHDHRLLMEHGFYFQIVYDEGPLYVYAKTEEVRAQWIKKLKECTSVPARSLTYTSLCLCVFSVTAAYICNIEAVS